MDLSGKKRLLFITPIFYITISFVLIIFPTGCNSREKTGNSTKQLAFSESVTEVDKPAIGATGRWRPFRNEANSGQALSGEQLKKIEKLESIGYLDGYREGPSATGVTINIEGKTWEGLNLCVSGHGPQAYLMDMNGKVLHTWQYPFSRLNSGNKLPEGTRNYQFWRRAYLYPNGDLLAIFEGFGIIKIDRHSNLVWGYPGRCHHDLFVTDDGFIYVLTRIAHIIPRIDPEEPVLEDFITILDPDGRPVKSISLLECFENSDYSKFLDSMPPNGDIFHTNTIEVLNGSISCKIPAFKKGNILISVLYLDAVAVVDPDIRKVVWAARGSWKRQHQPTLLDDCSILLFDNQGYGGYSKVIRFDPATLETKWLYTGSPPQSFYSETCGSCQQLPNGNILITESDNGRAFETTENGEIVWEYINPHRAGSNGSLIATLFEVVRLPGDYPTGDWCQHIDSD